MYYKPEYFTAKELLPHHLYQRWGENGLQFIDGGLLHDLDIVRKELDEPVIVNNTVTYNWSGLRTDEWAHYSPTSQHSFGRAVDFKLKSWLEGDLTTRSPENVRQFIKKLKSEGNLKYITAMEEDTDSWVHVDTRNRKPNSHCGLFLFWP